MHARMKLVCLSACVLSLTRYSAFEVRIDEIVCKYMWWFVVLFKISNREPCGMLNGRLKLCVLEYWL